MEICLIGHSYSNVISKDLATEKSTLYNIRHFEQQREIYLHQKDAMDKKGYTYILASMKNGTLYVGVTSKLEKRIYEHKTGVFGGFTKRYNIRLLVWYQEFPTIIDAIEYEKIIKKWKREKKINLIEELNPERNDLSK